MFDVQSLTNAKQTKKLIYQSYFRCVDGEELSY